jgi:hypothetical protein
MVYVVVVDLDGASHSFTIDPTVTTGEMLLDMMHQPHKTPEGMRLIFAGKQFASNEPLSTYNVVDGATIHMTGRLRGAGVFSTVSRDTSIGCMRKGHSSEGMKDPSTRPFEQDPHRAAKAELQLMLKRGLLTQKEYAEQIEQLEGKRKKVSAVKGKAASSSANK